VGCQLCSNFIGQIDSAGQAHNPIHGTYTRFLTILESMLHNLHQLACMP
jgi:hypothetical protein